MAESLSALFLQNPDLANAIRRQQFGAGLMQQGMDSSPIRSPWQGLSRLAQALVGGYEQGQADKEIKAAGEKSGAEVGEFLKRAMGGGQAPQPAPTAPVAPVAQTPLAPPDLAGLIEQEASARGLPPALATALYATESNFNPTARNPRSGAFGIGQVLASTAANPGYGLQPITEADLADPRKAVPWTLDYLKARGGALGVSDWNDPQQQARALRAYGENTDDYVTKVQSRMGAPVPQGGEQPAPAAPAAGMDPRAMQVLALEAATHRNPQIRALAPMLMQMVRSEDTTKVVPPGGEIRGRDGSLIARNTTVSPNVALTNDMRGPGAYDTERGKVFSARATEWEDAETKAYQKLRTVERFRRALDNVETGFGSQAQITFGQLAQRLGVPEATLSALGVTAEQTMSREQIRAMGASLVMESIGAGGVPAQGFSNADREFLQQAKPGLVNSRDGNRALLAVEEEGAKRGRDIGRAWREWRRANGDSPDSVRRFEDEKLPRLEAPDGSIQRILEDNGWKDVTPTAQRAQPSAPAEGATATNPQTGQRVIFRGGQWVPAQ